MVLLFQIGLVGAFFAGVAVMAIGETNPQTPLLDRRGVIRALGVFLSLLGLFLFGGLVFLVWLVVGPPETASQVFGWREAAVQGDAGGGTPLTRMPLVSAVAICTSAVVVLVTFFYTQAAARRQNKRQHTITLLFQNVLANDYHQKQRQRQSTAFGTFKPIHLKAPGPEWRSRPETVPGPGGEAGASPPNLPPDKLDQWREDRDAVIYMLNFFENIAAAIHFGDLDEELVRTTLGSDILCQISRCAALIRDVRTPGDSARDAGAPAEFFDHLVALYTDWMANEKDGVDRFFEQNDVNGHPVAAEYLRPVPPERRARWGDGRHR